MTSEGIALSNGTRISRETLSRALVWSWIRSDCLPAAWTNVGRYLHGDLICDTSELAAGMKLLRERICIVLLCSYRYDLVLMRLGLTR